LGLYYGKEPNEIVKDYVAAFPQTSRTKPSIKTKIANVKGEMQNLLTSGGSQQPNSVQQGIKLLFDNL
jgi:hypothetical protein